jgi:hypothetical protein
MIEHANAYFDFIYDNYVTEDTRQVLVEKSVSLNQYVPGAKGTADCIIDNGDTIIVVDYKYGKGVRVDAQDNPQLLLYALGALLSLPDHTRVTTVKAAIVQPRISAVPSTMETSAEVLLFWAKNTVATQAQKALKGDGEFQPSDNACRFCRAKPVCPGLAKKVFEDVDTLLKPPVSDLPSLTVEQVATYLQKYDLVKQWFDAAEERVRSTLLQGTDVPGYKLVEGRANRKILDQDKAIKELIKSGFTTEQVTKIQILPITELEKLTGKKALPVILGDNLHKPQGSPTLVPASDPRPPMTNIKDEFDKVVF